MDNTCNITIQMSDVFLQVSLTGGSKLVEILHDTLPMKLASRLILLPVQK